MLIERILGTKLESSSSETLRAVLYDSATLLEELCHTKSLDSLLYKTISIVTVYHVSVMSTINAVSLHICQ